MNPKGWRVPEYGDPRFCWALDRVGIVCLDKSPRHNGRCEHHEDDVLPEKAAPQPLGKAKGLTRSQAALLVEHS